MARTYTYIVHYDPAMLPALRAAREDFQGDGQPTTSTLLEVAGLASPQILIEVDAIAVID